MQLPAAPTPARQVDSSPPIPTPVDREPDPVAAPPVAATPVAESAILPAAAVAATAASEPIQETTPAAAPGPASMVMREPAPEAAPRVTPATQATAPRAPAFVAPRRPALRSIEQPRDLAARAADVHRTPVDGDDGALERGATAPQLRRFIKSRAYVPMHELRRRFGINGADDDVTAVDLERRRVFVGLPEREGRLLAELLRGGDIGFELSLDPISPIVVGVYPMRPVTRG